MEEQFELKVVELESVTGGAEGAKAYEIKCPYHGLCDFIVTYTDPSEESKAQDEMKTHIRTIHVKM